MIAVGSIFRDAYPYLARYFRQIGDLEQALGKPVRLLLVEGDSTDPTWNVLEQYMAGRDGQLIKRAHGGPKWGSIDDRARWRALSWCCNGVLEAVTDETALIYVESDLIWYPQTMLRLLDALETKPAVAAMSFTSSGHFYDTYGHRKDGLAFSPFPPYHPAWNPEHLFTIDSAGSCIAMRGDVAKRARFGDDDCVLGLGRSIWAMGESLWIDPKTSVVQS